MGLADSFKALSDPQRREILLLLRSGRRHAGELAEQLHISPSALSYHLKNLKKADMVIEYREKNYIFYELNTSVLEDVMIWISVLKGDEENDKKE